MYWGIVLITYLETLIRMDRQGATKNSQYAQRSWPSSGMSASASMIILLARLSSGVAVLTALGVKEVSTLLVTTVLKTGAGDLNPCAFFFRGGGTFSLSSASSSTSSSPARTTGAGDPPRVRCRRLGVGDLPEDEAPDEDEEWSERSRLRDAGRMTGRSSDVSIGVGLSGISGDGARERVRERLSGGVLGRDDVLIDNLEGEWTMAVWDEIEVMRVDVDA